MSCFDDCLVRSAHGRVRVNGISYFEFSQVPGAKSFQNKLIFYHLNIFCQFVPELFVSRFFDFFEADLPSSL